MIGIPVGKETGISGKVFKTELSRICEFFYAWIVVPMLPFTASFTWLIEVISALP